ncbi:hypothetical protein ACFJGW_12200 [Burkholderiaceae bacterium UC74_6]
MMNLTATPAAQSYRPASRLTGLGLAIGVHVILVIGFAGAFIVKAPDKPKDPMVTVVKEKQPKPPEPIDRHLVNRDLVQPRDPVQQDVPTVPWDIAKDTPAPPRDDGLRLADGPIGSTIPGPVTRAEPKVVKAGDVCTRMTSPEMPAVNFAGDATFRITASTQAGRVTSIQIQALSAGIDSRSLRAFKGAIERALGGYECPGNVSFTQEFNFRLE